MVNTHSIVYRKKMLELPIWISTVFCGDQTIVFLLLTKGNSYFINENMGIYRIHKQGISNSAFFKDIIGAKNKEYFLKKLDNFTKGKYKKQIRNKNVWSYKSILYNNTSFNIKLSVFSTL